MEKTDTNDEKLIFQTLKRDGTLSEMKSIVKAAILDRIRRGFSSSGGSHTMKGISSITTDTPSIMTTKTDSHAVMQMMNELGLKNNLSNIIYKLGDERNRKRLLDEWRKEDSHPAVDAVKKSTAKLLANELRTAIIMSRRQRQQQQQNENTTNDDTNADDTNNISDADAATKHVIVTPTDLFKTLTTITNNNISPAISSARRCSHHHGLLFCLSLSSPSLTTLRRKYIELHPSYRHIGLDDSLKDHHPTTYTSSSSANTTTSTTTRRSRFISHRLTTGRKVTERGFAPVSRQYLKYGAPASLRGELWRIALGLSPGEREEEREDYRKRVIEWEREEANVETTVVEKLFDRLWKREVTAIRDDEAYFPFEEILRRVLMCFVRDEWVTNNSFGMIGTMMLTAMDGEGEMIDDGDDDKLSQDQKLPSIYPFEGLVYLIAPLCLVYENESDVFVVFKHLHSLFWSRLTAIGTLPGMILRLSRSFETLLQSSCPEIVSHWSRLADNENDEFEEFSSTSTSSSSSFSSSSSPLQIAFPWLVYAFARYLEVGEILLLWDRIIAYGDLNLLPALAVSIFLFRRDQVLAAKSLRDVEDIFGDGSRLKVMPLLQAYFSQDDCF